MRHIRTSDTLNAFQEAILDLSDSPEYDGCIYVSDTNPVDAGRFDVLISTTGVVFLQYITVDKPDTLEALKNKLPSLINGFQTALYNKLASHRGLTFIENDKIQIKFPFIVKFVFNNLQHNDAISEAPPFCIFKDQPHTLMSLLIDNTIRHTSQYPYTENFTGITALEKQLIVFVVAPEYANAIPHDTRYINVEVGQSHTPQQNFDYSYKIHPGDIYANAFCLDTEQIEVINKIDFGHWLIISPAGSGKSVLLLSTALRFSKAHQNNKTLIVCRNRNLANVYEWKILQSGVRHRNINCFNVYRLCQFILSNAGVAFIPKDFDANYEKALQILKSDKLDLFFPTILIDEAQILREKYYHLFIHLIKKAHTVCLFGDVEQDINVNVLNKSYPWELVEQLNFGSNIIQLEKNYRNTINIAQFADSFLHLSKFYYEQLNIKKGFSNENKTGGIAFKQGINPTILYGNRTLEVQKVVSIVSDLKETVALSEIAILFINRQNKSQNYFLLDCLKNELQQHKVPFTELINSENTIANKIGVENGVVLATVESVLGLDFKVVILCGLSMLGTYANSKKLTPETTQITSECQQEFYKCCNMLYIAITRARERLFVLLTESKNESIYSKMFTQALAIKKRNELNQDAT